MHISRKMYLRRTLFILFFVYSSGVFATPVINGAVLNTRVFNDDSDSVLTATNNYPTSITIKDEELDGVGGFGFANLHNFRLSDDSGTSAAVFDNADYFEFYADVTITGSAVSAAGLSVAPWWSQDVDGRFNLRTSDGEIAVFGGRLPFYSFTGSQGLTYTQGTTVRLGVIYDPHSLSAVEPGTIEYLLTIGSTNYSSGLLTFDQGNPAEDPPYGLWGILNDARVGGYLQSQIDVGNSENWGQAVFANMEFYSEPSIVPIPAAAWLFGSGLLGLVGMARRKKA